MLQRMMFDDVSIPFPRNYAVEERNIQTENVSEGGVSIIQQTRQGVFVASISTKVLSDLLKIYKRFSQKQSFVLTTYDPLTEEQVTKTVHMEDFKYDLVHNSEKLSVTNGVYNVSFTLKEF